MYAYQYVANWKGLSLYQMKRVLIQILSQCVGRSKDPTGVEISYSQVDN